MRVVRFALAALAAATAVACSDATSPTSVAAPAATSDSNQVPSIFESSAPAPSSVWSGYSSLSPHFTSVTTYMTDFYYSWTPCERTWAGAHYDYAMSGSLSEWKASNSTVTHMPYALLWALIYTGGTTDLGTSYYADLKSWYRSHTQYSVENAFVHKGGFPKDSAHRITYSHYSNNRWIINPTDPGIVAYEVNRIQRITASEGGIFFDEMNTGDLGSLTSGSLEFASTAPYYAGEAKMLAAMKAAIGSKMIMINTAEYMKDGDWANAVAAGAVQLEEMNNFKNSDIVLRWQWSDRLLAAGIFTDLVSAYNTQDMPAMTYYPKGNSNTNAQRAKLWELASYYMSVPVSSPKLYALQLESLWSRAYSTIWTKAQEANIGHPTADRVKFLSGTDPEGNSYKVYTRDFQRALVIIRIQQGYAGHTYGDGTVVSIPIPAGETWLPLHPDGTVGGVQKGSIRLRNSEAAILLKGSKL